MEIRTFLTRLDAVFYYGHAGERSEEIAVRAGDHVGGEVWRQGRGSCGVKTWGVEEGLDRYENHARSVSQPRAGPIPTVLSLSEARRDLGSARSLEDFSKFDKLPTTAD